MSVTIKDIARHARLSPSTASRAINRSGYVSLDALSRVDQAITELGYQPNWAARALKGKPARLIGVIIPDILNVFYTGVANALAVALRGYGYEMVLCVTGEDPGVDLSYLQVLEQKRVDGLIYTHPAAKSNSPHLRQLAARGMPIVEINRRREEDLLDAVLADNFRGVTQVMEYLLARGHRRIAMICGDPHVTTGSDRVKGYKAALSQANLPLEPELLKIGSFTRQYGEQATRELLDLDPRPTAIFATSNRIALGSLIVLTQRGVRVPDDVSFVAFDDVDWMSAWHPPITTVDIAIDEMARLAVDLVLRRINNPDDDHKPITYMLSTRLIERASCKEVAQ